MIGRGPEAEAFGREVLGPVFAEFALRLHMLLMGLEQPRDTRVLFCARGGLRLRLIYEAFLQASGLEAPVACADLLVSRLIAARTALAQGSASAFEELAREFRGDSMGQVVRALTQEELPLGTMGDAPFSSEALQVLLGDDGPAGRTLRAHLQAQNRLFERHLADASAGARRLMLCDTGLYGSTVRLLQAGLPHHAWTCALFARCNYKGFSQSHFASTVGLCVEADAYDLADPRTAVLRYWHLIEASLEPDLPSVVRFEDVEGAPCANLVSPGWREKVAGQPGELFAGVLEYLRGLPSSRAGEQIYADAPQAWRRLHDAIVWPDRKVRRLLGFAERSRDFGRSETVEISPSRSRRGGLRQIQNSLWREGAVVDRFPVTRWLWLSGLHGVQVGRGAAALARRDR